MRIRRIELCGFKSFVDRTAFRFGPGICAVVGPNGCGKSNVIDAIKWTLGEQSPSTLRGREMLDVIFAGAEGRRPAAMAEVTVAFDNADASFGGRYARFEEVEVGRRLARDGTSTYLLNRTPCRRRDIVDLFLDTGVGARAYSIIEQGRVDFAVNASPEERRLLIEEVAGIGRFKSQRIEAERRMERTRENLVRVADLLEEMGRHRKALKVQATRARHYTELRAAWRDATLRSLCGTALRDRTSLEAARRDLEELKVAEATAGAALQRAVGEAARLRERSSETRRTHEDLRDRRSDVASRRQIGDKEAQLRGEEQRDIESRRQRQMTESADLGKQQVALGREAAQAHEALAESREAITGMEARLAEAASQENETRRAAREARARVEATKAAMVEAMTRAARSRNLVTLLEKQVAEAEERLAAQAAGKAEHGKEAAAAAADVAKAEAALAEAVQARAALAEQTAAETGNLAAARAFVQRTRGELREATQRRQAAAARLQSLDELIRGLEGFGDGAKRLVRLFGGSGEVLGTVADLLRPPEDAEAEVELALGERLRGLVVRDPAALACHAAVRGAGRLLLVPAGPPESEPRPGSLAERVDDQAAPGLAARLLGESFVEPSGAVRDHSGLWTGGDARGGGLLAQRRSARQIAQELAGLDAALDSARRAHDEGSSRLERAEATIAGLAKAAHEAELAELTRRRDLDDARARARRLLDAERRAGEERLTQQAGLGRRRAELEVERASAAGLEAAREQQEAGLEGLREAAAAGERAAEQATAETTSLRVALATVQQAAAGQQRDARRIDAQLADVERRQQRALSDLDAGAARLARIGEVIARLSAESLELAAEHESLGKEVAAAAALREEAASAWQRAEEEVRTVQARLDDLRRRVSSRDVAQAEARTALQAGRDRAAQEFDLDLDFVLERLATSGRAEIECRGAGRVAVEASQVSDPAAIAREQQDAIRLAAQVEALGPVNLAADAEFAEIDSRFGQLQSQRTDLETALADLRQAIGRIERETKDRFQQAFGRVGERFGALYPRLVGGGRAELHLLAPDDLLTTGIDIVVEPPGKRLQNLSLLSGGEKAMAAIALVFAVFQVKPSPFCLLDEVDAPLDDTNSRRLGAMLKEMSSETQFLVITHNRTTMESADVLYGVTMQKPGVSSVVSVRMD